MQPDRDDVHLPPHGGRPHGRQPEPKPDAMLPCTVCGKQVHRATLATFGARCMDCYDAYCAAAPKVKP